MDCSHFNYTELGMLFRVMPPRSSPFFLGRKTSKHSENNAFLARDRFSLRRLSARWKLMTSQRMWCSRLAVTCILLLVLLLIFCFPPSLTRRAKNPTADVSSAVRRDEQPSHRGPQLTPPSSSEKSAVVAMATADADPREAPSSLRMSSDDVIINPHNFRYIINEEDACSSQAPGGAAASVVLLIFVSSSVNNYERRMAIRESWGGRAKLRRLGARLLFLTGVDADGRGQNVERQRRLSQESARFHDILQEDFVDSYLNLTIKSVMGLKWMTIHCPTARYVMKTDDDIYVNVGLLVDFLQNTIGMGRRRWIGGCIKQVKSPLPFNREGVKVDTMAIVGHPPFTAGAGYILSGDLVPLLYQASQWRPLVPVEDAFVTGYCARMVGVMPSHYDGFSCGEPVVNDCQMALRFVGHHVMPERQHQIWKTLNENINLCKMLA